MMRMRCWLFFSLIVGFLTQRSAGFLDETCANALVEADADKDNRITGDEYVTMVQLMGPDGFLSGAESFEDLPIKLRTAFNLLACQCEGEDCCLGDNAHISNEGIEDPNAEQAVYFFTVCFTTARTISQVLGTDAPTSSSFPTNSPSMKPSQESQAPSSTPSVSPSDSPSDSPSLTPSILPTLTPSIQGSDVPSSTPSRQPSEKPSSTPSIQGSDAPSSTPSKQPTDVPSSAPSKQPSEKPSLTPTASPVTPMPVSASPVTPVPTGTPTLAPITPSPVTPAPVAPTPSPVTPAPVTLGPTAAPTPAPTTTEEEVIVNYDVGLKAGYDGKEVNEHLKDSMTILANEIVEEEFANRRLRRKLAVTIGSVSIPSFLSTPYKCPDIVLEDIGSGNAVQCNDASQTVLLMLGDEPAGETVDSFKVALEKSIIEGRLQEILTKQYPGSSVFIVTGYVPSPTEPPSDGDIERSEGIGAGAAAGISVAAVVAIAAIGTLLYVKRRRAARKEDEETFFPGEPTSARVVSQSEADGDIAPPGAGDRSLGATPPDFRKSRKTSQTASKTLAEGESDVGHRGAEGGADSSSNAGSSGWSSSAGVSSLNTGSIDSMDIVDKEGMHAASLAAIAGVSAIGDRDGSGDAPDVPNVTRDDLDSAIESGDWAAVGATAALLAAASDSQSYSSRSRKTDTSTSRGGSSVSSLDAARAAELDHLVDAGDWEGVVVAAAKFEASEDTSTAGSRGSRGPPSAGGSSGYGSQSGSVSESASKAAKRDEIRSEVESLVRRVVPEEIDNVDEMMLQFKGREEELVETLRTMQERQVAQKARVQGQKQAKRDARQTAREGGIALPGLPPSAADAATAEAAALSAPAAPASSDEGGISAAAAAGIGVGVAAAAGIAAAVGNGNNSTSEEMSDSSTSSRSETSGSSESGSESQFAQGAIVVPSMLGEEDSRTEGSTSSFSNKRKRTALELAIEAGDWEAVGEAAAMMSDASVTTADTSEINRIAEQGETSTFSGESSRDQQYKVNAERALELDEMIDAGDWTGVVAAASRYNTDSRSGSSPHASASADVNDASVVSLDSIDDQNSSIKDEDKEKRIKEEQDALAQAEIWMAIAEQSKTEGSEDAGASDAADWAIARSLSALKKAEQKGELDGNQDSDSQDRSV